MRELGVSEQCQYPGFSADRMHAFVSLAHDLSFAADFLEGKALVLQRAALKEAANSAARAAADMASYAGDTRTLERMRSAFREKRFGDVVRLSGELRFPDTMTPSQRRMVEMARARIESGRKG
jgi:hypothetical protein